MSVNHTRDYKAIGGSADRTKYDHWCDAVMGPEFCFTQLHFIISVVLTLCKPNRFKNNRFAIQEFLQWNPRNLF